MNSRRDLGAIYINSINLWAHVGVLHQERLLGQYFNLDIVLWLDVSESAIRDDLSLTVDYSLAVKGLQKLALDINCLTIEGFSEHILDFLDELYGPIPKKIFLQKINPPINGFTGHVAIERSRYKKFSDGNEEIN